MKCKRESLKVPMPAVWVCCLQVLYASLLTCPLVFKPQEAPHYLTQPGYLQLENGWAVSDDNKLMIAVRTDMGNGTVNYDYRNIGANY